MTENQIIIYQSSNGQTAINVKLQDETVWLTLNQISDLFYKNKSTISRHLNNIYKEEELKQEGTVAKKATVQKEGNRIVERTIEYYSK
ncbi:hypothetical protein FBD94_02945 [Pedobacter hiemivivus]|uniref:Cell filamentation protein Fic n=1 Tax=Pedobacter hiemivivus TaxID=2530454 RepID=A0A4U1GU90_9SPHI|nr:hypothetical protein [Pedobacter hiemivivus]TCC96011.1 hypothetical protein EZ444_13245 [Pedobacter hiemivivus]TKC65522.1 hypothetical protein FBD94_02945 [Pedobacter hiemivivus]